MHLILKNGAIGIFADGGAGIENYGDITLYGEGVIGIAGKNAGNIVNYAVITVTGENSTGIYGTLNTVVQNKGTINVSGNGGIGIIAPEGKIINEGTINYTNGAAAVKLQEGYAIPELINAGIINVNGHFSNEGMEISIKPNLDTLRKSDDPGVEFVLNSGSISAGSMDITNTVSILSDFSQGTNAKVYKMEDVFLTSNGSVTSSTGKIPVVSKSLTWEATPKVNDNGNIDIYMQKIDYHKFTDGLWFDDFGKALDEKYDGATGDGGKIFDKLDILENERDFRHVMGSLAGNVYSNINQREDDIAKAFENSLSLLQGSKNNTKENVKVNIIAGRGRNTENTDGVTGYDYATTGVLALREVERTYKHTFGYSMGYLHTGFEFKDGNQSEEWVDTIQLGVHNKYTSDNWKVINNLTGRVGFHNIDRNIDWPSPTGRSEMNGTYETYSITSDNILGKEIALGKKASITPYGAFRAMYVTRPDFSEKGLEALEVEGNDAWSAKPRAGVELKGAALLGSNSGWQLKGSLDVAYEYELADLNEREKARLVSVEDNYHKLSKPEDEKGTFRTRATVGVEVEDRYGIFVSGEYGIGDNDQDDYRVGVTLKAVF
ncbi:autotransporter domain-containing protein [Sebaldella sp. S0638]|uniref:autotransporter family protein n=1 Tax=Sebaldella sp. S0638 TaxID=2957809 RepID=UPI00209DAD62|nr:autotransporter domain-containing protein [Sebaldella sp. S0638]